MRCHRLGNCGAFDFGEEPEGFVFEVYNVHYPDHIEEPST